MIVSLTASIDRSGDVHSAIYEQLFYGKEIGMPLIMVYQGQRGSDIRAKFQDLWTPGAGMAAARFMITMLF